MGIRLLILAAALFLFQSLNAELDWNITGSGARAAGMGNAFIGVADDATAINWNPGGLTALEHLEASFVGASFFNNFEYKPSDNIDGDDYENYAYSYDYSHLSIQFASFAYPLKIAEKKLVLALAYQKQLDFFEDYEYEFNYAEYTDYREGSSEGGVSAFSAGAAYEIIPSLSLGACANFWMGSFDRDGSSYYDYTSGSYSSEYEESEFKNFKGFNITAGALFDMSTIKENVPLKLGAVIKTPFELEYDLDYSVEYEEDYISDGPYESSYTGKVEIPLMFGAGASYRFGEFFTVSVDFESRLYGDAKEKQFDENGDHVSWSPANLSDSKDDVNQIRLGMEYLVVTDNFVIPVRCGAFNHPTLRADIENDLVWDDVEGEWIEVQKSADQAIGYGLSFGSGMIFDKFAFDLSYTYLNFEYSNTNIYPSGSTYEDNFTTSKSAINFSAILYIDSFMNK